MDFSRLVGEEPFSLTKAEVVSVGDFVRPWLGWIAPVLIPLAAVGLWLVHLARLLYMLVFALVIWLPLTVWLLYAQRRAQQLWVGAAAFSISILVLMFIGRTFNNYYLVWPMTGAAVAALMAAGERGRLAQPYPSDSRDEAALRAR